MTCRCKDCATAPGTCDHCIGLEQGRGWDQFTVLMFLLMFVTYFLWSSKKGSVEPEPA